MSETIPAGEAYDRRLSGYSGAMKADAQGLVAA